MFKYIKYSVIFAALLLVMPVTVSAKKKITVDFNSYKTHGTNALDYVLQKPLPADSFPAEDKGFGKHFFIGAGGGFSMLGNDFSNRAKPGLHLGGELGSWFTPVHGIRIGADLGFLSVYSDAPRCWFGSLKADYLLNMTNLLRGYKPQRKFELITALGVDYRPLRQQGEMHLIGSLGASAAMQARFNVAPSLYLFVEPRLAMITGDRFNCGGDERWRRIHTELSFNVGLGYRILQGRWRAMASSPFSIKKDDDLYFGAGVGAWGVPREGLSSLRNPFATVHVGKQLSAVSSLQMNLGFGQYRRTAHHKYTTIASLDYVLNIGNACGGYRPNAVFQTFLNVGVAGGMATLYAVDNVVSPGIGVGLTGMFRLSENWGLYVHPQAYLFRSKFSQAIYSRKSPLAYVDLGLRYTIGNFSQNFPESYETYNADTRHWFISAGAGVAKRMRGNFGPGADLFIGFGKRFTPVSSWRLQFVGDAFPRSPLAIDATIHLDYLSSITTAMCGYNPDRVFDLQLVLGAFGGGGQYDADIKPVIGLTGGLQFGFRLNKHLDLYLEPQLLVGNVPMAYGARKWAPEPRAQLGLRYKIGTPKGGRGSISETPYGDHRNFASFSAGPEIFTGSINVRNLNFTGSFDLAVGRWFSMVSGLRLTFSNDWTNRYDGRHYIGAFHLNYLLNVTSLIDRSANRRFHIIGAVGGGLGFSPDAERNASIMANAGVQFRYNLPWNIDIHLEPGISVWPKHLIPRAFSGTGFEACGRVAIGASYRF